MRAAHTKAGRVALGAAVAGGVRHMAHRFIAGATPREALGELERLWKRGIAFSADLLGEATVTSAEADAYAARCAEALDDLVGRRSRLARATRTSSGTPPIRSPRVNLSVKVSALTPVHAARRPQRWGARTPRSGSRRSSTARASSGAHLHVDMESLDSLETTLELAGELLAEERVPPTARPPALVLQAYLRDSPAELDRMLDWAGASDARAPAGGPARQGRLLGSRVGRGPQHGWRVPVFTDKRECDRNFEALTRRLLDARPRVRVAIASHNLRSISHAIAYNRLAGGRRRRPRAPGAPRARRRARDRARGRGLPRPRLLAGRRPRRGHGLPRPPAAREHLERLVPARPGRTARRSRSCWRRRDASFENEPTLELRRASDREPLLEALAELDARLPLEVPPIVAGDRGARRPESTRPTRGHPIGWWRGRGIASEADVEAAVRTAAEAARDWGAPYRRRARRRAPARRPRSSASAGSSSPRSRFASARKPWAEADADVCEAIDFLRYYARARDRARARAASSLQVPGERNDDALRARAASPR